MTRSMRWTAPLLGLAAVVALFLLLRPGGGEEPAPSAVGDLSPSPSLTASVAIDGATGSAPSPTATRRPERTSPSIAIEVRFGGVKGPRELEVTQGDRVVIEVSADVADEVHVHGYDLSAEVTPARPAAIAFLADATGVYEVELENAGLLLFVLQVVP